MWEADKRRYAASVLVYAMCVAALAPAACTAEIAGTAVPAGDLGGDRPVAGPDDYEFPGDGSDFPRGELDQPMPVPGFNWRGWAEQDSGRCAWVPAGLFDGLAADEPFPTGHFCSFHTVDGDNIQITWGTSYGGRFSYDPTAFLRPAEVAGLQARVYDLAANQNVYPGSCSVEVSTRSISSFSVLHWNERKEPLDLERSCAKATEVAEIVAAAMVPLAGGSIWPATVQEPQPELVGGQACDVVNDLVTTYARLGVRDEGQQRGRDELGTTCAAERDGRAVATLLTDGPDQGLAQVPPPDGAEVTELRLGPLAARKEVVGQTCAVAVELVRGRLLRIQFSNTNEPPSTCMYARLMAVVAVARIIEKGR